MNKTSFQKGAKSLIAYPVVTIPSTSYGLVDPHVGMQHEVPEPIRPCDDGWDRQVELVKSARADVEQGVWPNTYISEASGLDLESNYLPEIFKKPVYTMGSYGPMVDTNMPESAAALVHMDRPYDLGRFLFEWLWDQGAVVQHDKSMHKFGAHDYKLNALTKFDAMLSVNLAHAYHDFMAVKNFYGLVRPEEYFDLPGCMVTHYDEGCPKHASYVAGHGTFAGRTQRVLFEFFDINQPHLAKEIEMACWYFAHFRTFAGVHWPQDNDEGLRLGNRKFVEVA